MIYNHLLVAAPKQRADTIEQLRDALVHMAHSREGAYAGLECVWHGTAKDRKAIIKSFKTFMLKTAQVSVCFDFSIFITGFRIRIFFLRIRIRAKSSCGSGSGSWGYPGEGAGGKGKK